MSLGEFELIERYFTDLSGSADEHVLLGIGDDAAVLSMPAGHSLVVSTDTLVEGVHFPESADAEKLARRALRVNLSDLAAMGAQPKWATLALTLPKADCNWLEGFSRGLGQDLKDFGCWLVGGDTTRGPLTISFQMLGWVRSSDKPITRKGAKAGDHLVVTGTLGDAAASLALGLGDEAAEEQWLLQRYWAPQPRIEFALLAAELVNAGCDLSDGLVADARHLCDASGLGLYIEANQVPRSDAFETALSSAGYEDDMRIELAMTGGDDYELCMAVADENLADLSALAAELSLPLTSVGRFEVRNDESDRSMARDIRILDHNGQHMLLSKPGYRHF